MSDKGTEIAAMLAPIVEDLGLELLGIEWAPSAGRSLLRLYIDAPGRHVGIQDCESVSREVSALLDVNDPIGGQYTLEVSSPGIDRPLVRKGDFAAAVGHLAKLETTVPVEERRRFRGRIVAADDESVVIERDQAAYGEEPTVRVPFDVLAEAKLILTDDLIREALRRDKELRRAANDDGDAGDGGAETED